MTAGRFGRGEASDRMVRRGIDVCLVALVLMVGTNYAIVAENRYSVPSIILPVAVLVIVGLLYEARATIARSTDSTGLVRHLVDDPKPQLWALLAFVSYAVVLLASSIGARDPGPAVTAGLTWVTAVPIVAAISLAACDPRRFRLAVDAVVAVLLVLAVPTVVQRLTGTFSFDWYGLAGAVRAVINDEVQWRSQGTIESNAFGAWLVIYIPIGLLAARQARSRLQRIVATVSVAAAGGAVLSTYSRGPLIGLIAVALLLLVWLSARQRRTLAAGFALAVLMLTVAAPHFWTDQFENVREATTALQGDVAGESSTAGHLSTFRAGLYMFGDHPLLGVGARNFVEHYGDYVDRIGLDTSGKARSAHSAYAQVPAETGLAGTVVVVGWVAVLGVAIDRARRRLAGHPEAAALTALGIALIAHAITSLFRSTSHPQAGWIVLALVLARLSTVGKVLSGRSALPDGSPPTVEPASGTQPDHPRQEAEATADPSDHPDLL